MKHFYFVRHGQSVANAEKLIADANSPLAPLGILQVKETTKILKSLNIDLIISSPMIRAIQTAETIADSIGYDKSNILIVDELRERGLGDLENKPKTQNSRWYFDTAESYGMETHQALYERMKKAINRIEDLAKDSKNILLSGHSISGDMLRLVSDKKTDFSHLANYELTENAGYFELNI